jgi:hypothetical protein
MSTIESILQFLDYKEIDYRLESNFCCGYIFYFLDGSVYPRRYYDNELETQSEILVVDNVDHLIAKATGRELQKDWRHRIEADTIENLFKEVEQYLRDKYKYQ